MQVKHGIFRSSPFFLAVQEAYSKFSTGGEPTGVDKLGFFLGATDNSGPAKVFATCINGRAFGGEDG